MRRFFGSVSPLRARAVDQHVAFVRRRPARRSSTPSWSCRRRSGPAARPACRARRRTRRRQPRRAGRTICADVEMLQHVFAKGILPRLPGAPDVSDERRFHPTKAARRPRSVNRRTGPSPPAFLDQAVEALAVDIGAQRIARDQLLTRQPRDGARNRTAPERAIAATPVSAETERSPSARAGAAQPGIRGKLT